MNDAEALETIRVTVEHLRINKQWDWAENIEKSVAYLASRLPPSGAGEPEAPLPDDLFPWEHHPDSLYDNLSSCRGCGEGILPENRRIADGCPCNSRRGINHGLVPRNTCCCFWCDPASTGSTRIGHRSPTVEARDAAVAQAAIAQAQQEQAIRVAFEDGRAWGRLDRERSHAGSLVQHYRQNVAECQKQKDHPIPNHLTGEPLDARIAQYQSLLEEHKRTEASLTMKMDELLAKYADPKPEGDT